MAYNILEWSMVVGSSQDEPENSSEPEWHYAKPSGEVSDHAQWDHTFGCEYCGSCMERARKGMPQNWEGSWRFLTSISSLATGVDSDCSECGVYVDAWTTFLRDICPCLQKETTTLFIRVYHYANNRLGIYLNSELHFEHLHTPQDHQTFVENPREPGYRRKRTRLKLFRAEGM